MNGRMKPWAAMIFIATAASALLAGSCKKDDNQLSVQEAEALCVDIVACQQGEEDDYKLTNCVGSLSLSNISYAGGYIIWDIVECLEAAGKDCSKMLLCINENHASEDCEAASYPGHCEGDMEVTCSEGTVHYFDCSRLDAIYGDASCQLDSVTNLPKCTGPTCTVDSMTCNGNTLEVCSDGTFVRMDCGLLGAQCGMYGPLQYCVGSGPDCASEGTSRCDGSRLITCTGGKDAAVDCADLLGTEYTCTVPAGEERPGCGPRATQCDQDYTDHCEGNLIVYCRAGNLVRADCTAHGYASCAQGEIGPYCR